MIAARGFLKKNGFINVSSRDSITGLSVLLLKGSALKVSPLVKL